jgi:hypothetical protein
MQSIASEKVVPEMRTPISAQFVALLGILLLSPLPLGSNRPWALALLEAPIMNLLVWNLWSPNSGLLAEEARRNHRAPWQRAKLPLYLMAAWAVLVLGRVALERAGMARENRIAGGNRSGLSDLSGKGAPLNLFPQRPHGRMIRIKSAHICPLAAPPMAAAGRRIRA